MSHVILMRNMADAAIARREARRRKILANSHNRLQLISGKNSDDLPEESQSAVISDQICDNKAYIESNKITLGLPSNGILCAESIPVDFSVTDNENEVIGGNVPTHDLAALGPQNTELNETSILEKITTYRYDVVVLSLLIQLLYSFSIITYSHVYFFLPLILHVITKNIWLPKQTKFNFANALLLLNGVSASRVQKIVSITQWIGDVSQDICVFVFSTVCIQAIRLYGKEILN